MHGRSRTTKGRGGGGETTTARKPITRRRKGMGTGDNLLRGASEVFPENIAKHRVASHTQNIFPVPRQRRSLNRGFPTPPPPPPRVPTPTTRTSFRPVSSVSERYQSSTVPSALLYPSLPYPTWRASTCSSYCSSLAPTPCSLISSLGIRVCRQ